MKEGAGMKRTVLILLSLTLSLSLLFGSGGSALAAGRVTKVVTGEIGASLRSSPELKSDNKIGGVHAYNYLDVYGEYNGWYYVKYYGQYGWVNASPQIVTVVAVEDRPAILPIEYSRYVAPVPSVLPGQYSCVDYSTAGANRYLYQSCRDMGVPQIGNTVFTLNQMNLVILWVQTQLKATGIWYQGVQWELNGALGEHTMSEISSFMASNGYCNHSGVVDQNVLNLLATRLGSRLVPVWTGGFYNYMNTILSGDPYGSMAFIVSNLRDNVARETVATRWVQTILSGLGYYTGPIDGKYGKLTQSAVILFQRDNSFQERDYVSLGVARAMLEQYYRLNKDLSCLP